MTALARLMVAGLVRARGRTAVRTLTLAAVALLGAMVLFVGHSLGAMSSSAVSSVPLDWQAPVTSYKGAVRASAAVGRQLGVLEAAPVATTPFAGIEHRAAVGTIRSGAGSILAVAPGYLVVAAQATTRIRAGSERQRLSPACCSCWAPSRFVRLGLDAPGTLPS